MTEQKAPKELDRLATAAELRYAKTGLTIDAEKAVAARYRANRPILDPLMWPPEEIRAAAREDRADD